MVRPVARRAAVLLLIVASGVSCRSAAQEPAARIVQPGGPGEPSREISPTQAVDLSRLRYTAAEAQFMQRMIAHHAQALEMTALLAVRSSREDMQLLGRRIHFSQTDEIEMMREWLSARGAPLPSGEGSHSHDGAVMPGMLTTEEMRRLADATGGEFDRLFLELMIKHHEGALIMVDELFATPGAGQQSDTFAFASDVEADQRIEIDRMSVMLEERAR
jgi:uncharacterized protein (DUF305 family)